MVGELATLLASTGVGAVIQFIGAWQSARREQRALELQALSGRANLVNDARRYSNKGFQWTRRIIALTATFSTLLLPKLAALYGAIAGVYMPIAVSYTEVQLKLFGLLQEPHTVWERGIAIMVTPLDTHLMVAIIGLYFGGSLARR